MIRQPIRNNASDKPTKPRVFDAIIDGDEVYLEAKLGKDHERINLRDVLAQVEAAKLKAGSRS